MTKKKLRKHINIKQFVITFKQISEYLDIDPQRILNWEKWHNVLWVHIEGKGGYFISYRKLEQWLAACASLIRRCRSLPALDQVWTMISQESQRYTTTGLARLERLWRERYDYVLAGGTTSHPRRHH